MRIIILIFVWGLGITTGVCITLSIALVKTSRGTQPTKPAVFIQPPKIPLIVPQQRVENLPAYDQADAEKNTPNQDSGIVALFENDVCICTATVISNKLALTAAHCLTDEHLSLKTSKLVVKNQFFKGQGITATPSAINLRSDLGLISGDFSKFKKFPVSLCPGGFLNAQGPFTACGLIYGSPRQVCINYSPTGPNGYQVAGNGLLYPGMSGGPVIDLSTGNVVAINTRAEIGFVVVSPLVGLQGQFGLIVHETSK